MPEYQKHRSLKELRAVLTFVLHNSAVFGTQVNIVLGKGKVCLRAKGPIRPELIPVSVA